MTIPTMINNHERRQLEVGLRRSYSLINQALDMHHAKSGDRITAIAERGSVKPILMEYMKVVKDCGNNSCYKPNSDLYKNFTGKVNIHSGFFDDGQFVLNDGSLILLEQDGYSLLLISVDVNGYEKGPNRAGLDLFMFQVDKNGKLLAVGSEGTRFGKGLCSKDLNLQPNLNGFGCTVRALSDPTYFKQFIKF